MSYAYSCIAVYGISKFQFLIKTNVLTVLLEYQSFTLEWQHKTSIWEGLYPCLYHSILPYSILNIVTVAIYKAIISILSNCFPSPPASILKGRIKTDYLIKSHLH